MPAGIANMIRHLGNISSNISENISKTISNIIQLSTSIEILMFISFNIKKISLKNLIKCINKCFTKFSLNISFNIFFTCWWGLHNCWDSQQEPPKFDKSLKQCIDIVCHQNGKIKIVLINFGTKNFYGGHNDFKMKNLNRRHNDASNTSKSVRKTHHSTWPGYVWWGA